MRDIVEGTAATTGEAFFDELVRHMALAMETKCAWVTEWLPEKRRLRSLSFWVGDGWNPNEYEYSTPQTPCDPVVEQRELIHIPDRLLELYPGDPDLKPLGPVSYIGVPLLDTDDSLLGHLAVMHTEPLPEDSRRTAVFNIFAARAAAELRRVRRDRDLREREQKLSRLIGSAMDAILELDDSFAVTAINPAGETVFGCARDDVVGRPFGDLLTSSSSGKIGYLADQLARDDADEPHSMFIPGGIEARRADGTEFPAEATLSRYEFGGRDCYTVILRDIDQRIEAETRIRHLLDETAVLRAEINELRGFDDIVGRSDAVRRVLADVDKVAASDTTVLITGETGTGKELIARAIHRHSPRADHPLVKVNCAAIAATLQESEFFGHEKGAFTGATQRREGRFQLADGGTIFLDEVGEMPLELQAKLLRVLQEGEFEPVGSATTVRVNVRVIAATNRDLAAMVQAGDFREDLLYRLNVFPVHLPPLRERGDDVVRLAETFARSFARRHGRPEPVVTPEAMARLKRYDWPGNIRELQNVIERALITSPDGRTLDLQRALPDSHGAPAPVDANVAATLANADPERILTVVELRDLERRNIERALAAADGKISGAGGAAELLGMNPNTLTSRIKSLEIQRPT